MSNEPAKPALEILGVYRLAVTEEMFLEQLPMYGNEAQCRDHFSSVVLIEAIARNCGDLLNLDDFRQPQPFRPNPEIHPNAHLPSEGSSQVPWDEGLLTEDGRELMRRSIGCVKGGEPLRFAFYMHYWNEKYPLLWTFGEVVCQKPQEMPERLQLLMPYRPCD